MADERRERQLAEVDSLEAIFGDDFSVTSLCKEDGSVDVEFRVCVDPTLAISFRFPIDYPDDSRPIVEITWSGAGDPSALKTALFSYVGSLPLGDEMAYTILTWCQERLADGIDRSSESLGCSASSPYPISEPPSQVEPSGNRSASCKAGGLPLAEYFRAESLGEGGFGSVMHVYDNDGQAWAAKQFESAEDGGVDTSTLREVGLLRALRTSGCAHPNVIALSDMAAINGELCMIMVSYQCSLRDALVGGAIESTKGVQPRIAKGLLSAVAFLHASGTMHRDIKPGNVMLTPDLDPVLIDFSLAKVDLKLETTLTENRAPRSAKERRRKARGKTLVKQESEDAKHSQGVGTPLYMAPEVLGSEEYSEKADIWSSGVVLLEVFDPKFREALDTCEKEKAAHALVAQTVARLGAKPMPSLLKGLLEVTPTQRLQAQVALDRLVVAAGSLVGDLPDVPPVRICSVADSNIDSLPAEVSEQLSMWTTFFHCSGRVQTYARVYASRSQQARSQPLHAVVLAGRLHETDVMQAAPLYDLEELWEWAEEEDDDLVDQLDSLQDYFDSEKQILEELDYQLY